MARAVEEHGKIEFIDRLTEQALKALGIGHAFIYLHPQQRLVALFQQAAGDAAAAGEARLHAAHERFRFVSIAGADAVVDVIVMQ